MDAASRRQTAASAGYSQPQKRGPQLINVILIRHFLFSAMHLSFLRLALQRRKSQISSISLAFPCSLESPV